MLHVDIDVWIWYTVLTDSVDFREDAMPKELTVREAALRLGVTPRVVAGWVRRGYFPGAYKLGLGRNSPFRIPEEAVKAFDAKRRDLDQV